MPAIKTTRAPIFLALLEEAIETMRQTAPPRLLELELSEELDLIFPYDDGPYELDDLRSSVDEDDTVIAKRRDLGRRGRSQSR